MTAKGVLFSTGALLPLVIVFLAFTSPLAKGATAGELLEKAIYAEETAGDLDAAIKLYEQVIAEAKTAKSAAAKAQYRLGLIYEKQGKAEPAAAAFRAVVEDYPGEKELVAEANKRLPSAVQLSPAPWIDGEELQLNMKLATGLDVGTMIYCVESAKHENKDAWRCTTYGLVTANGAMSVSRVLCEQESFAPINSLWRHSMLGEATAVYSADNVKIDVVGKDKPVVIKTSPPVFDNEQAMELFRRLPLKVGYKTTINVVASLGAGALKLGIEVPEMETIEAPAGKYECYKLVLNIGQTIWISNDEHRYVVRFQAGGVTGDLVRIDQRRADEPKEFRGNGIALTLPAGWHALAFSDAGDDGEKLVHLLDPEAFADSEATIGPLSSLKEDQRKSPKAWTELAAKNIGKMLKDFKVREIGDEVKVAGRPAAVMIADFEREGKKLTMYGVAVFSDSHAINFRFTVPADKFDSYRPVFGSIVNSLKLD